MSPTEMPPNSPTQPDGWLDTLMTKLLGRSWRTSAASVAGFACAAVAGVGVAAPGVLPPNVVAAATALAPLVTGVGLWHAKDDKATGLPPKKE